jgi:RNA polymerase sigma-70 factor (ECF subfamily)
MLEFSPDTPALDENAVTQIEDPADDPEATVRKNDRTVALRRCLARLSPAHREIIDLIYYHQQSIAAVAEILGTPQATVKTRMFYARKRLARLLADQNIRTTAA